MTADQDKTKPTPPDGKKREEPVDALRNPKNAPADVDKSAGAVVAKSVTPSDSEQSAHVSQAAGLSGKSDASGASGKSDAAGSSSTAGSAKPGVDRATSSQSEKNKSSAARSTPSMPSASAPSSSSTAREGSDKSNSAGRSSSAKATVSPMQVAVWISLVALVVVVFLGLALWWQHQRFESVAREVATRLQTTDQTVARLQQDAQKALASVASQTDQLSALQRETRSIRSEMTSMDQAWQSMSRSLDDNLVLSNVRRLLNMAQQQLTLIGNVNSTISVLETAQSLLENHQNQEKFGGLLKAVQTDLERLRSTPQVNIDALAAKLNRLVDITEKAPLQIPDRVAPGLSSMRGAQSGSSVQNVPANSVSTGTSAGSSGDQQNDPAITPDTTQTSAQADEIWWQRWLDEATQVSTRAAQVVSREFSDLMQIRKADSAQVLLLSEEQAMMIRTNLRSMLLSAQLALLNRQPEIWTSDLQSVQSLLETYYSPDSLDTRTALRMVAELKASPIALDIEPITESLSALAVTSQTVAVPESSGVNN